MKVREIKCKQALSPCKIKGFDYSLNPYVGCSHGCVYCYACFMCKYRKEKEKWGEFVDVKINIPEALETQVKRLKPGMVMVSSVTDAYQPLEKKYEITRQCLEILAKHNFKIGLLTKSSSITRDIDVIKKFGSSVCPGFTIMCFNAKDAKNFEPGASSVKSRLISLKKLNNAGISTSVFIGPFIPGISDKNIEQFLKCLKEIGVKIVLLDKLNIKSGNWPEINYHAAELRGIPSGKFDSAKAPALLERRSSPQQAARHSLLAKIKKVLDLHYPNLAENYYQKLLTDEYYKEIKNKITNICGEYKLPLRVLFR